MPSSPARFQLISGNRLDALAARLGARLAQPPAGADADDLRPETVLVPQPALRHWLLQALAERHGIAANLDIRTPTDLVWALLRAERPELPVASPWDPERLRWPLYALLSDPEAALPQAVRAHLQAAGGGDAAALARFALAGQLAQAFDRYLGYRADWLARWDAGEDRDDWQAALWRLLRGRMGEAPHRAALIAEWLRRHDRGGPSGAGASRPPALPPRLSAFGTLHVPPDQLRMLGVAAQWCAVDFYLPVPSAEYWGDVEALRTRLREGGPDALPAALAEHQADNPLLAAWGAGGREIVAQLFSYDYVAPEREIEDFVPPGRDTLLHRLQDDVLRRAPPQAGEALAAGDVSLQLHACHSRLREVEVLHDRLRAMLDPDSPEGRAFDPPLQPREVAVMAPDIGAYLPLARAVFGGFDAGDPRHIPFSLADRPLAQSHPLLAAFLDLLDLGDTPLRAGAFLDLLSVPAIAQAQGLDAGALARLAQWCEAAAIRWGEDADARVRAGVGRWREYSFDFGFDRLLAGYAAGSDALLPGPGGDGLPLAPVPLLEGADAEGLDRALAVYTRLRALAAWMRAPHEAQAWAERLGQDLQGLLAPVPADGAEAQARQRLLEALDGLAVDAAAAGATALPAAVVRTALRERLLQPPRQQPWLSGGVTFAGMVPLRTVPFRVVCLLGLDADAFPRRDGGADIQRTVDALQGRAERRLGDRSVREDDRFLFLQLLCAAGEVFYLSYGGKDARDGSVREPSAVVSELLEVVERMHGADARVRLCLEHPLQPFSVAAFGPATAQAAQAGDARETGSALARFSYRREWRVAPVAADALRAPPPFVPPQWAIDVADADAADAASAADVPPDRDTLQEFFANPARAWLRERLGLRLGERSRTVDDDEPLGEDGLLRHAVLRALLRDLDDAHGGQAGEARPVRAEAAEAADAGSASAGGGIDAAAVDRTAVDSAAVDSAARDDDALARELRARGALPPGLDGERLVDDIRPLAQAFRRGVGRVRAGAEPTRVPVESAAPVAFRFDDVWRDAEGRHLRLAIEPGKANGKRLLRAGLDHLLLAAVHGPGARTVLVTEWDRKSEKEKQQPPDAVALQARPFEAEEARRRLVALLALMRRSADRPLAFAPNASWVYVDALRQEPKKNASPPGHAEAWNKARETFAPDFGDFGEVNDRWIGLAFRPDGLFDAVDSVHARDFAETARAVFDALPRWDALPLNAAEEAPGAAAATATAPPTKAPGKRATRKPAADKSAADKSAADESADAADNDGDGA